MKLYKVLGLMSGTSVDGLDMAVCHFWMEKDKWNFEIREAQTIAYDTELADTLKKAISLSDEEHEKLHYSYGTWLGKCAKAFLTDKNLTLDFIASHGHTSHHRPDEGYTFQLGHGQALANASGQKVVCDFRSLDVQLGGQGAPLVPIGDELLLPEYDFCLNLGGISNISFKKNGQRMAFDIGLANMPLNYLTRKIGIEYDANGERAKKGVLLKELLDALNELEYYQLPYPKSTGIEWFEAKVIPLLEQYHNDNLNDLLHTVIQHNCEQIQRAIRCENPSKESRCLVTGGGALNGHYMTTLKETLRGICEVVIPPKKFINYKEALVFALMGVLKIKNETNILASVTGAERDSCSGEIFSPKF